MRELTGVNLFNYDNIAITTNGFVKKNGACVMGRGCALTARDKYPGLDLRIGRYLTKYGNRCFHLGVMPDGKRLFSFVVKHSWEQEADPVLIRKSCVEITQLADKFGITEMYIPRPGCGNGRLSYDDIRPILEELLDDRFIVVTF